MLHEQLEDTLDWLIARCGFTPPSRPPRALRAAVRALDSDHSAAHLRAEQHLRSEQHRSVPLLRQAACSHAPVRRAVRAAVLLHRMNPSEGEEVLRRLVREHHLRNGEGSELLRNAVRDIVGPELYVRQAAAALLLLEQRPESFRAITRYRQALEILRFLDANLPVDMIRRALTVRTVGGENLSLIRTVLADTGSVPLEHVCLIRKETVDFLLSGKEKRRAYGLLLQALAHPSPAVKLTAIYGLEELGDTRAMGPLAQIAKDADSPVSEDARRVIEQWNFGYPDVFTLLRPANLQTVSPAEMLRPVATRPEEAPHSLLRIPKETRTDEPPEA